MRIAAVLLSLLLLLAGACKRDETAVTSTETASTTTTTKAPAPAATASVIELNAPMPPYTATELDGSAFDLSSRHNKVVLLNVWATWCGPCRYEIPELQAIHDKYKARGFEVIGVSVDEGASETVKTFVEEKKMTYPVVLDPRGTLADMMQTTVLPTTVLVDRKGIVTWKKLGAIMPNDEELDKAIQAAL